MADMTCEVKHILTNNILNGFKLIHSIFRFDN